MTDLSVSGGRSNFCGTHAQQARTLHKGRFHGRKPSLGSEIRAVGGSGATWILVAPRRRTFHGEPIKSSSDVRSHAGLDAPFGVTREWSASVLHYGRGSDWRRSRPKGTPGRRPPTSRPPVGGARGTAPEAAVPIRARRPSRPNHAQVRGLAHPIGLGNLRQSCPAAVHASPDSMPGVGDGRLGRDCSEIGALFGGSFARFSFRERSHLWLCYYRPLPLLLRR